MKALQRAAGVAAAILAFALPSAASAQATREAIAEALFKDAQERMKAGKVAEACEKFQASYETDPALGTLLNLAVCHEKLGRTATAWSEFNEVAAKAARAGQKDREQFARGKAKALEAGLLKLEVNVASRPEGLVVKLDGAELPAAIFGSALPVDPGAHVVEASAPGYQSTRTVVHVEQPLERIVVPALQRSSLAAVPPPPPPPPPAGTSGAGAVSVGSKPATAAKPATQAPPASVEASGSDLSLPGYVTAGAGALALAGGGILGLQALSHADKRDEICAPGQVCTRQEAFHEDHLARTYQQWGFVAAGVGVAAAAAGAWMIFSGPDAEAAHPGSPAKPATPSKTSSLRLTPWLAPDLAGASLCFGW